MNMLANNKRQSRTIESTDGLADRQAVNVTIDKTRRNISNRETAPPTWQGAGRTERCQKKVALAVDMQAATAARAAYLRALKHTLATNSGTLDHIGEADLTGRSQPAWTRGQCRPAGAAWSVKSCRTSGMPNSSSTIAAPAASPP